MEIKIRIDNDTLSVIGSGVIVGGSKNYYNASAVFTSDWNGLERYVVFPNQECSLALEDDSFVFPEALISESGVLPFGIIGLDSDGELRISTNYVRLKIIEGAREADAAPPSPDESGSWEGYLGEIAQECIDAISSAAADELICSAHINEAVGFGYVSGRYNAATGEAAEDDTAAYIRSEGLLPIIDGFYYINNRLADLPDYIRFECVFFDADKSFLSSFGKSQFTGFNISGLIPEGAAYMGINLVFDEGCASPDNVEYAAVGSIDYIAGRDYVDGCVSTDDNSFLFGYCADNAYKSVVRKIKKGSLATLQTSIASANAYAIALFDCSMNFIKGETVGSVTYPYEEYMLIADEDGYVVATSALSDPPSLCVSEWWQSECDFSFSQEYSGHLKDGSHIDDAIYAVSRCVPLKKGDNVVINAYCSSSADAITLIDGGMQPLVSGISDAADYYYSYYAAEDSILRFTKYAGTDFTYRVTHPMENLNGKTICAIGDDYLDGNNLGGSEQYSLNHVWINLLAMRNNMTLHNYGSGGSTIAAYSGCAAPSSPSDSAPVCTRCLLLTDDYDIILFQGGRNDYEASVALGSYSSKDNSEFYGALNSIVQTLLEKYPEAVVAGHPNWTFDSDANSEGYSLKNYRDAFIDFCEKTGVPIIDTRSSGVVMNSSYFRAQYTTGNASDLNASGHARYARYAEKQLNAMF